MDFYAGLQIARRAAVLDTSRKSLADNRQRTIELVNRFNPGIELRGEKHHPLVEKLAVAMQNRPSWPPREKMVHQIQEERALALATALGEGKRNKLALWEIIKRKPKVN